MARQNSRNAIANSELHSQVRPNRTLTWCFIDRSNRVARSHDAVDARQCTLQVERHHKRPTGQLIAHRRCNQQQPEVAETVATCHAEAFGVHVHVTFAANQFRDGSTAFFLIGSFRMKVAPLPMPSL